MPAKIVAMPKSKSASKSSSKPSLPEGIPLDLLQQFMESIADDVPILPSDVESLQLSLQKLAASEGPVDERSFELEEIRFQANDLVYDAMDATSLTTKRKLLRKALSLDPDCVDALVLTAKMEKHTLQETIGLLQKAVDAGERTLGKDYIEENKGHFWGLIDTRPYMRALGELALALHRAGLLVDAIDIFEKMLELNPNDNQGIRESLLGAYLHSGALPKAAKLLRKYKRDASAAFAWGRVLERLLAQDPAKAAPLLVEAREINSFVEEFLVTRRPLPFRPDEVDSYTMGSLEEAVLCMESVGDAWRHSTAALAWLRDNAKPQSTASRARKAPAAKPRRKTTPKP